MYTPHPYTHMYTHIPTYSHAIYTPHTHTSHTHVHIHTHLDAHTHTHLHSHTPYIPHIHTLRHTHTTHTIPICTHVHTHVYHTYTRNTQHTQVTHVSPHSLTCTHSCQAGSPGLLAAAPEASLPTCTHSPLAIRASGREGTGAGAACERPRSFSYTTGWRLQRPSGQPCWRRPSLWGQWPGGI